MSEADFGLTNKGSIKMAAENPVVVDAGAPTSSNPGNGDLRFLPQRADNSTGVTSPKASGPIK